MHRQNSKGSLIPEWGKHTADHSMGECNGFNSLSWDNVNTQTSSGEPTLEFVRLCIINAPRPPRWGAHTLSASMYSGEIPSKYSQYAPLKFFPPHCRCPGNYGVGPAPCGQGTLKWPTSHRSAPTVDYESAGTVRLRPILSVWRSWLRMVPHFGSAIRAF